MVEGAGTHEGYAEAESSHGYAAIRFGVEWVWDPDLHRYVQRRCRVSRWARRRLWSWQNRKGRR